MQTALKFKLETVPSTEMIIDLYNSSGINRPTTDHERISRMYANSNLVVTAWDEDKLVGIARSLTDFCYCCYLSDLAVREEYKCKGIGRKLIEITKEVVGDQSMLLLLAAPAAMEYYPKVGLEKVGNGFIIKRTN
jgi:predicted N-acetyltransferase YhbS